MSGTNTTTVYCPAGQYTKVIDTSHVYRRYRTQATSRSGQHFVVVKWRRYSTWPPHYWEGSFTDTAEIYFPPDPYIRLEFNPSSDADVYVEVLEHFPSIRRTDGSIGISVPQEVTGLAIPR